MINYNSIIDWMSRWQWPAKKRKQNIEFQRASWSIATSANR